MRTQLWRISVATLCLLLGGVQPAHAITLGQVDNFQDGTPANWKQSILENVANEPNTGPAGIGDNAMRVTSTNRMVTFNQAQWTGNYIAAGVTRLTMDVRHQNAFSLWLRIGISNGSFGTHGSGDTYVTKNAIEVPNDNAWHSVAFDIAPGNFEATWSNPYNPNPAAALANVTHLRIIHNPVPQDFTGAFGGGNAIWRFDNITAAAAPVDYDDYNGCLKCVT